MGPVLGAIGVGLWPVDAPVWGLRYEGLDGRWFPEPTVLSWASVGVRRTRLQLGAQVDGFHREWAWQGATWESVWAVRFEGRVGARTELGPVTRDRTDPWVEYGAGWIVVPERAATHPLYTQTAPTLHVGLGVARGTARPRPFGLLEGRLAPVSWSYPMCVSTPCPSMVNAAGGPGIALVVGVGG